MRIIDFLAISAFLLSGMLHAATPGETELAQILEQQRELQSILDDGRTNDLTKREINSIHKAQKQVFELTNGKASLDELAINEKVRLENALEQINAIVSGGRLASDEQTTCWRERKSGSKLQVTRCGTEAERNQAREGARAWMEKPKVCVPPGCGR